MNRLMFTILLNGKYAVPNYVYNNSTEEIAVVFYGGWQITGRNTIVFRDGILDGREFRWIWKRANDWYIDFDALKKQYDVFNGLNWLKGVATVIPEIIEYPNPAGLGTNKSLEFRVYLQEFVVDRNRKIFLSHKTCDKPAIREYFEVLKTLGFDPWLDEDAIVAGTSLERGILDGFEQSCAAVFFVTHNFEDENFLATEVNYAMAQKREKGERFSIITMVISEKNKKGKVPSLLKQYVWKEPQSQLEALNEIVRALPLISSEPDWKGHISANSPGS